MALWDMLPFTGSVHPAGLLSGGYEVFYDFNQLGRTAGLGQIAYHLGKKIAYVSDFETGKISVLKDNGPGVGADAAWRF